MARPFRHRDDLFLEASLDRITATGGNSSSGRLGVSLYTGIGGILVVIAVVIWMGFALVMAAPASQAQAP